MATSDIELSDLFDALAETVTSVPGGLHLSPFILDPSGTPNTIQNRSFSMEMQTVNSKEYRDGRDRRIRMEHALMVRVVHRMNPKRQVRGAPASTQVDTQRTAFVDESNVIIKLMTVTSKPLCYTQIRYLRTKRTIDSKREWYYTDIMFSTKFDFELGDRVAE